jgi:HK97 family phage major capsid protein
VSERHKQLMEKALQCIQLARAIKDRYPDPTQMTADDLSNMKNLTAEGIRLKQLAAAEHEHDELEAWAHQPDGPHPALVADAATKAAGNGSGPQSTGLGPDNASGSYNEHLAMSRFAKALRGGVQALTMEEKAALVENATGEIIVPHEITGPIFKTLPRLGVLRGAGPFIRPTTSNKVDVRSLTQPAAGWGKLELGTTATDANIQPAGPDVVEVHDLISLAQVGVDELEDTDANLTALIQEIIGRKFAEMEDDAFANGNGVSKPWGLAMRASAGGPLITQAVTASANATVTGDDLKRLPYRVPATFRGGGAYFASGDATEAIALLKDSTSNYLWQPNNQAGQPDVLFGRAFYTVEGLPAMSTSAAAVDPSVLYGDLSAGYMVADRRRITFQRLDERFAEQGLVGFLFKQRVGGDVIRPAAFAKLLL